MKFWGIILMAAITGVTAAEVVLFDGAVRAAVVVPAKANNVEQLAARELSGHLQQATGQLFPVINEDRYPAGKYPAAIYIGNCEAARAAGINVDELERFQAVIRTAGNNLYLAGRDDRGDLLRSVANFSGHSEKMMVSAGTLFAVYDFLDRELGVVHLWPGASGTFVPKRSELKFDSLNRTFKPWGLGSSFWLNNHLKEPKQYWENPETFRTFEQEQRFWLLRHRFCSVEKNVNCGHEFRRYWRRFGKTHPEYFSRLPNGERRPLEGDVVTKAVSMCVSNPGFHRQIVEDYKERYNPSVRPWERNRLSIGENDTPGLCTCEVCRSWDDPADKRFAKHPYWGGGAIPVMGNRFVLLRASDGSGNASDAPSLSDRYSRYYLAVQAEARKFNPDVNVIGFAYANYAEPPNLVKLNDKIIISFVGWPYFPFTGERMEKARRHWDGWRDTGAKMLLRPNATHVGHNMPVFYGRKLGDEFRHAQQNGALSVSYDSMTGQWGVQSASLYILARLNARPDLTVDEVLNEYYSAFGPAGQAVKAYTEFLEKISDAVTMEQVDGHTKKLKLPSPPTFKNWLQLADLVFSEQFFDEAKRLLARAENVAQGDTEAAGKVKYLQTGLEHAEKTYMVLIKQRKFQKTGRDEDRRVFEEAFKELWHYRHSIEGYLGTDLDYLAMREVASGWKYDPKMKSEKMTATPISHAMDCRETAEEQLPGMFAELREHGAEFLVMNHPWCRRIDEEPAFLNRLVAMADKQGLRFTDAHSPYGSDWDLNAPDPERRLVLAEKQKAMLTRLANIGVKTYVIHIGRNYNEESLEETHRLAAEMLEKLLPVAEHCGIIICLENIRQPANSPEALLRLLRQFNSPYLGVCYDSGHAAIMNHGYEALKPWIVTCHLHDNDGKGDYHRMPGDGIIDWQATMAGLKQCPRLLTIQSEVHWLKHRQTAEQLCRVFRLLRNEGKP